LPRRVIDPLRRFAKSEYVRHGAMLFATMMSVSVFGYIFHFVLSRKLGVDSYGSLSALNAAITVLAVPSQILTTIVTKYSAEFRATGDLSLLRTLVTKLSVWAALAGVAILGAGALATPLIGGYLHITDLHAVFSIAALIALSIVVAALRGVLAGTQDFVSLAISWSIDAVLKTGLAIALAFAGFGLVGAMFGWVAASALALAYTLILLLLRYRGIAPAPLRLDLRRLVLTSGNVALATLCVASLGFTDVVIVKHFFSSSQAGLYGATSLVGKMLFWLVGFVPTLVLPKAADLAQSGKPATPILLQALATVVVLAGAGLAALFFFPGLAITTLTGRSYSAAAPLVFPYGVATVLLAGLNTVVFYKIAVHRFDFVLPLIVVAAGEIAGVSLYHATLSDVIRVLIVGNAAALLASLYRVAAQQPSARAVAPDAAAA
jgi:O-antigen/teichoic acid export membrane protein